MTSYDEQSKEDDNIPPNLLLNPRANAINLDAAPLAKPINNPDSSDEAQNLRFTPEEEASLLAEATNHKSKGNTLFTGSPPDYEGAINEYKEALSTCPKYLGNERCVYHANIAACFIKLQKWKEAEEAATNSLIESGDEKKVETVKEKDDEEEIVEIKRDVAGNWKARLRRAKAREMVGTWASLQDSLEDYKILSKVPSLPPIDAKNVRQALSRLPPAIDKKKDQEIGEMMGKLKGLGDGILKPFGLSTDNFNMIKDEKSGGYSMNFNKK